MKNITQALLDFQSQCPTLDKNAQGYGYKYCDLPSLMEAISPLLSDLGLCLTHTTELIDGNLYLRTSLLHKSGEMLQAITPLIIAKKDMQGAGASITYARRYGICSLLNIVADDDPDDMKKRIDRNEHKALVSLLNGMPNRDACVSRIFQECEIDALENMPKGKYDEIIKRLIAAKDKSNDS